MKSSVILYLLSVSTLFAQNLEDNMLLHYEFNGDATDSSINDYHGTVSGATFDVDRFGNPSAAAYFDGIDDFIDLPNVLELKPDFPISFSFYIKYDSEDSQDRAVFNTSFEDDRSSGVYFNTQISTGNYAINYGDGTYNYVSSARRTYVSNEAIEINNWHHVAVIIRSATDMSIYVDCIESGGQYSGTGGSLVYSDTAGSIGKNDRNLGVSAEHFKGRLDDFRYWDREITIDEIDLLCDLLSVEEFETSNNFIKVHPNPVSDNLAIQSKTPISEVKLINMIGQVVLNRKNENTLNVSNLESGLYFLRVADENGSTQTIKVLIN